MVYAILMDHIFGITLLMMEIELVKFYHVYCLILI